MRPINLEFNPPVIAHRGASRVAPENTLAAFRKARELGAKWVEFDVMLAACGEPVVIHDETLDRTTNGSGRVGDYSYDYLKTLDAGSWFSPAFAGERIPTLREVIQLLHDEQLAANIEIKSSLSGNEEQTVKNILEVIKACWQVDMSAPLISSFSCSILFWVKKYSPASSLGFLMDEWQSDWRKVCDELNCVSVNVNQALLNPERVAEIKATGRSLLVYTVNDEKRMRELLGWGVDAVFSD